MHNISIFGTSSDAGKSTITFVIAKILQNAGYRVAPFKAQNVSNNAHVAHDGSEIAVAQHFQAEALEVPTSYHNNPVLLKSGRASAATLIVNGEVVADKDVHAYYRDLESLKPAVKSAFETLAADYDCVVAEGAGSPVELNLMAKDLSNIYIAQEFNTKIILVADIEKGGTFASIYGVYNLLPPELQKNVIGVIVNKFRGDISLFDEGIEIIEKRFGIPVLGVLPYRPFNLGFEDSQSLINYRQNKLNPRRHIGVISYPTMSNYNDLEPLIADEKTQVEFIHSNCDLGRFDQIILPGSKLVMRDLQWLKETGLFAQLQETSVPLLGICGGYEMMFNNLRDPEAIESDTPVTAGLGLIDDDIIFTKEKILKRDSYELLGRRFEGFEIHHGVSAKYPLCYERENLQGTFAHNLFNDDDFQAYKRRTIDEFVAEMSRYLDTQRLIEAVL